MTVPMSVLRLMVCTISLGALDHNPQNLGRTSP